MAALTLAVNGRTVWIVSALTSRLHVANLLDAVSFALMVTMFSVALNFVGERGLGREPA